MSKGTTFRNDIQKLIFQAITIANVAINATSSPLTNLYVSLHTADPTSGSQTTSEAAYTGYARVAVPRDATGFDVSGAVVTFVNDVAFPIGSAGGEAVTHFAIGVASSGASKVLYAGALDITINTGNGVIPIIENTTTITEV